jgi:hypothetical protein
MKTLRRRSLLAGAAAVVAMSWAGAIMAAPGPAHPAPTGSAGQAGLAEPRWLPWMGCWELTADAVDHREVESTGRRVVCVAPRPDGSGVALTTHIDGVVITSNTVVADDRDRPLQEQGCSGVQRSSWSADGHRIHSRVEGTCEEGGVRSLSGLSMLIEPSRWLVVQSVSLDSGSHREIVIRHYQRLDEVAAEQLGFAPLDAAEAARAATARAAVSGPLDLDDVLEMTAAMPVEVVEAAILESDSTFDLDRDALFRIADAGVDEHLIDLMVAVSFPEQFVVDTGSGDDGSGYGGYGVSPYQGSCYGLYYGAMYGPYGYCGTGFTPYSYYGPRYGSPYYRYPVSRVSVSVPATGSRFGGRVIKGRGYATVRDRDDGNRGGGGFFGNTVSGKGSGGARRSGGMTGSPTAGGKAGVSSSGYTQGGGGGSAGSSGSGGAKPKAKPRGGSD